MLVVFDLRAIQVATGILASFGIGEACPARAVSTSWFEFSGGCWTLWPRSMSPTAFAGFST